MTDDHHKEAMHEAAFEDARRRLHAAMVSEDANLLMHIIVVAGLVGAACAIAIECAAGRDTPLSLLGLPVGLLAAGAWVWWGVRRGWW